LSVSCGVLPRIAVAGTPLAAEDRELQQIPGLAGSFTSSYKA
jgi:hypothetical protein